MRALTPNETGLIAGGEAKLENGMPHIPGYYTKAELLDIRDGAHHEGVLYAAVCSIGVAGIIGTSLTTAGTVATLPYVVVGGTAAGIVGYQIGYDSYELWPWNQ